MVFEEPITARLENSTAVVNLREGLPHLSSEQVEDVIKLVEQHSSLFKDTPGLAHLISHDVDTGYSAPIKQHPYRIPLSKWAKVKEELVYMVEIGAIEPASSE